MQRSHQLETSALKADSTDAGVSQRPVLDHAVKMNGVGKRYRLGTEDRWVIQNIDLNVRVGECLFLVGPSGSGKSTLLSILGCLLTPDEGEVLIHGISSFKLSPAKQAFIRRQHVGFVFQKFQLIRGLSAAENVAVPLTLQGVATHEALQRSESLLERVGLWEYRNALPTRLSPGQCQRIAIARALISKPGLVLADEPTASLDAKSGMDAMELLKDLVQETGASAVVVTHDTRIYSFADRICTINNGQLESTADRHDIDIPETTLLTAFPKIELPTFGVLPPGVTS